MSSAISTAHEIPGPRPLPLLGRRGNVRLFQRDPLRYVLQTAAAHGPIAALAHDDPRVVFVTGRAAIERLIDEPQLFRPVHAADRAATQLLQPIGLDVLTHQPSVSNASGAHLFAATYDTLVSITQERLEQWAAGQQVDAVYVMSRFTRHAVLSLALGDHASNDPALRELLTSWRLTRPGALHRHSYLLMGRIRSLLLKYYEVGSQRVGVLRSLASSQDASGLAAVVFELLMAQEPIAVSMAWTLFLLSQHPRVLADVERELEYVVADRTPSIADLHELRTLERVIRETWRLLPPLGLGARVSTADCTLGPYAVPAGATILYSPYLSQREREIYVAPLRFRPERWLYLEPPRASFLPFGIAPDLWDGGRLAMQEMKLILTLVLQRFRLALAPGVRIGRAASLLITPRDAIPMIIGFRDRPLIRRSVQGDLRHMLMLA